MKNLFPKILFNIVAVFLLFNSTQLLSQNDTDEIHQVFSRFENGIKSGVIEKFSGCLMFKTYISLENGVSSYFSEGQAFYILQDFIFNFKPISFKITKINVTSNNPFLIGQLTHNINGTLGESRVFVSLKSENGKWEISQIIIN